MAKKYVVDKKSPEKKKQKRNTKKFFKDTMAELKKVSWPTKPEVIKLTGIVIVFVLVFAILTGAFDFVITWLMKFIY